MNFSYSNGNVSASNGWSYSIRGAFDYQYQNQPQYKTLADGYRYLANMAIGIADDDYRAKYGVMPGTNLSEFGQWIDGNRQAVYNEAQGWFTYVPPTGGTGTGSGSGTGTGTGTGGGSNTLPDCNSLSFITAIRSGVRAFANDSGSVFCTVRPDWQTACRKVGEVVISGGTADKYDCSVADNGDELFGLPKEYLIYGAIGIVALMLMNK